MKKAKIGAAAVLSVALVAGLSAAAAPAFAVQGKMAAGTSWTVPTAPMTNAVKVDGKSYKVITANSASNWVKAGPDYLGVSNSNDLGQGGGQSASGLDAVRTSSLVGVWASEANEVPNAYNWNSFYNLYAASVNLDPSAYASFSTQSTGNNYDSATGVKGTYKYRPEILWGTAVDTAAVQNINEGKYYTSASDETAGTTADPTNFAAPNDDKYNPTFVQMTQGYTSSFQCITQLYEAAEAVNSIESSTKDYNANGAYNADNVNWRTVNALPRTTRYESDAAETKMSAEDCAVAFEKCMKGSVYYALSKIADGTVAKKTVAYITVDPDATSNTATVAAFDCIDAFSPNDNSGLAGASPLAVNQLTSSTKIADTTSGMISGMSYATYTVTADELATCDVIFITGSGKTNGSTSYTTESLKQWVVDKCTTAAGKAAAAKIQYAAQPPVVANAHNFTIEKSIFTAYSMDFIYPELFPNMELETYWYDNIYHLKSAYLKQSMQWGLGNVSLPDGCSLESMGDSYSVTDCDNKFYLGYNYFTKNATTDPALKASVGTGITGKITGAENCDFSCAAPTEYYGKWAASYNYVEPVVVKDQTISAKNVTKTYKAKNLKKKAKNFKLKATAKTSVSFAKKSGAKKITVSKAGKVVVKKGLKKGTYKATVKITAAANASYNAATKTITVTVKVK